MNLLRGDLARLQRCTSIITGGEGINDFFSCKDNRCAEEVNDG